jgi:hypothetical protein
MLTSTRTRGRNRAKNKLRKDVERELNDKVKSVVEQNAAGAESV